MNSENFPIDNQAPKKVELLHSLSLSGFNPSPCGEKLSGDLFYIHARSLEGQDLHITASPLGFYLNQSRISFFNPNRLSSNKSTYVSLFDLFKAVSAKFKSNLETFLRETKLTEAMKFKFYSGEKSYKRRWLEAAESEHGWNNRRTVESHIKVDLLSLKDWN